MTNYDLEEAELITLQIVLSVVLLFTTIISITLSYDFLMKLEKKEPLYAEEEATDILIFNRLVMFVVAIIFIYINIRDKSVKEKYNSEDEFADLQFMPDFYQYNLNYAECSRLDAAVKYNASQTVPIPQTYCAQDSPIYNLNISYLSVDGKSIGDIAQYKSLDIYPTNIYFKIQIFFPDTLMFDDKNHIAEAVFSYESKYGVRYSKRMTIEFKSGRISKILLDKPERTKHGKIKI